MKKSSFILFTSTLVFVACAFGFTNPNKNVFDYDLASPSERLELPDTLREISGICQLSKTTFVCVQDENGILFIYDIQKNEIIKQYFFAENGDYEGIARVGSTIFVLRSDGVLYEIQDFESDKPETVMHQTGVIAMNNEGLCYDEDNNRLLIAAKGKIGKGPELKDKRIIYGFDLKSMTLIDEPIFDFNLAAIKKFARNNNIELETKVKKNKGEESEEEVLKFMTSAISIHPKTKRLYLLSAAEHLFFIFDEQGNIEHMEQLDKELFNKAEGITFLENGDMLVSNEAQTKKATLLRFNYKH